MTALEPSPTPIAGDRQERTARVAAAFRDGLREIRCMGSERLLRHAVSMSHLHVMSMLEQHGEMTMNELAETLDVSLSNTTGLVDRMTERGFVERVRVADDRRIVLVRITDAGCQVLAEVDILRDELLAKVLGRLDDAALERLERSLGDIRGAVMDVLGSEAAFDWHQHLHQHSHAHGHAPGGASTPAAAAH